MSAGIKSQEQIKEIFLAGLRRGTYAYVPTEVFSILKGLGWSSDGSTLSTDTFFGVRIGKTTNKYCPDLPAWAHDCDYKMLRWLWKHNFLNEEEHERLREKADNRLRLGLIKAVRVRVWDWVWKAIHRIVESRALIRYDAVRLFGESAAKPK